MAVDETLLNEVVRRVLTVARPDRIILFGSAATGQMTEDSDLDLLVVEPESANTRDRSIRIRRALGDVRYPVDVIVMSRERFEETKNLIGGVAYPASKYGRILMKPPDAALRELVMQWLAKAAADFDAAEQLSNQGGRFREIVAFHCQQAVEKYLKALLVRRQIEFPKTHDIAKLLDLLATVGAKTRPNYDRLYRLGNATCPAADDALDLVGPGLLDLTLRRKPAASVVHNFTRPHDIEAPHPRTHPRRSAQNASPRTAPRRSRAPAGQRRRRAVRKNRPGAAEFTVPKVLDHEVAVVE